MAPTPDTTHVAYSSRRSQSSDQGWKENFASSKPLLPTPNSNNQRVRKRAPRVLQAFKTPGQLPTPAPTPLSRQDNLSDPNNSTAKVADKNDSPTTPAIQTRGTGLPTAFFTSPRRRPQTKWFSRSVPDRFLSYRSMRSTLAERYRLTRPANQLTGHERFNRNHKASMDPFMPTHQQYFESDSHRRQHVTPDASIEFPNLLSLPDRTSDTWGLSTANPETIINPEGTTARTLAITPTYNSSWISDPITAEAQEMYVGRLAAAMSMDFTQRILTTGNTDVNNHEEGNRFDYARVSHNDINRTQWTGTRWENYAVSKRVFQYSRVPTTPFKTLNGSGLRDDFYCSLLAWNYTYNMLAVGLGGDIYGWSLTHGVVSLARSSSTQYGQPWMSALDFSSRPGNCNILAYADSKGLLAMGSLDDILRPEVSSPKDPRFKQRFEARISCMKFSPNTTKRISWDPELPNMKADTETLLVGDERGSVAAYSIEWPRDPRPDRQFCGSLKLLTWCFVSAEQICGLAWNRDGSMFAVGSNDNTCTLYTLDGFVGRRFGTLAVAPAVSNRVRLLSSYRHTSSKDNTPRTVIPKVREIRSQVDEFHSSFPKHVWRHNAAVKAIAFCPWQKNLVATGSGSSDRCIRFFNITTGHQLASICVAAQVTSLIWAHEKREIVATLGYAIPEHSRRIVVYSWPECREIMVVP